MDEKQALLYVKSYINMSRISAIMQTAEEKAITEVMLSALESLCNAVIEKDRIIKEQQEKKENETS